MRNGYRLVCDSCFAFRRFESARPVTPAGLRTHAALGPFVVEHEDCRPPLRITSPDDAALEGYREHYEEA
jgi:hypothetical protein